MEGVSFLVVAEQERGSSDDGLSTLGYKEAKESDSWLLSQGSVS